MSGSSCARRKTPRTVMSVPIFMSLSSSPLPSTRHAPRISTLTPQTSVMRPDTSPLMALDDVFATNSRDCMPDLMVRFACRAQWRPDHPKRNRSPLVSEVGVAWARVDSVGWAYS